MIVFVNRHGFFRLWIAQLRWPPSSGTDFHEKESIHQSLCIRSVSVAPGSVVYSFDDCRGSSGDCNAQRPGPVRVRGNRGRARRNSFRRRPGAGLLAVVVGRLGRDLREIQCLNFGGGPDSPVGLGSSFLGGGGSSASPSGATPSFSNKRLTFVSLNFMSYVVCRKKCSGCSFFLPALLRGRAALQMFVYVWSLREPYTRRQNTAGRGERWRKSGWRLC